LQLTELRAAKPSSLSPVKDDKNRFLAFKGIQTNRCALNGKPTDVRGHALGLKREQQR
jgi:hypothetical protein